MYKVEPEIKARPPRRMTRFTHLLVEEPKHGMTMYELRFRDKDETLILAAYNAMNLDHAVSLAHSLLGVSKYNDMKSKVYLCGNNAIYNL